MRVLYFHQHFSTRRGAAGTRSYEMASALVARGHEVVIVCGRYDHSSTGLEGPFSKGMRRGVVDGIEVLELELPYSNRARFWSRAWTFTRFALRGIGIALRERYDIAFATSTPLTASIPSIVGSWVRRKPFVFEVRDLWPELPREMGVITNPVVLALLDGLEWVSYRAADRLIGLAPGIVSGITRRGVPPERVSMIPNGCDLDLFDSSAGAVRPSGVSDSDLMAIFTGAHGIANGLDAVLDTAAELRRRGVTEIKLVFVGDGQLKERLVARAVNERLDNCIFLPPVPKPQLVQLLNGADVGLMILANVPAFYYGTSPNKFFDYIAAGLPVLTNYPGWVADMVHEYDCGVAVSPDDPVAFADALEALAHARHRLGEFGARARELACRDFERGCLAERFVGVLEEVGGALPEERAIRSR